MIIDRLEEKFAIVETMEGSFIRISKSLLPPHAAEGDCIILQGRGYTMDEAETRLRKERIAGKLHALFSANSQ